MPLLAVSAEEHEAVTKGLVRPLMAYAPGFKGPITPEESVQRMRSVLENASIENGSGGAFVSHYGNKQWV